MIYDGGLTFSMGITAYFAELMYGMTSFGVAICFQMGWQISHLCGVGDGEVQSAVLNLSVVEIFTGAVQVALLSGRIDWLLLLSVIPWQCGSVLLGGSLQGAIHNLWLKRSLGIFLLLVAVQRLFQERRSSDRLQMDRQNYANSSERVDSEIHEFHKLEDSDSAARASERHMAKVLNVKSLQMQIQIALFFGLSGVLGMLFGVSGPPLIIFFSLHDDHLDRDVWRATSALLRVIFTGFRLLYFYYGGLITFDGQTEFASYTVMVISGLLGLVSGNYIAPHVKDADFRYLLLSLLTSGSLLMLSSGWDTVQRIISMLILVCAVVSGLVAAAGCVKLRRRRFPQIVEVLGD